MGIKLNIFRSAMLPAIHLVMAVAVAQGQSTSGAAAQEQVATVAKSPRSNAKPSNVPMFSDYRGIRIGMTAEEVRAKFDRLKKDRTLDVLDFSEQESAQIHYDNDGKVRAISIDYFGEGSNAPSPEAVLGMPLQAKDDGSMYQLQRYPEAGYWVSYNRTKGDKPIVTITTQKM